MEHQTLEPVTTTMHRPLHSGPKKCTNLVATTWFPIILLWDKPVSEGLLMTGRAKRVFPSLQAMTVQCKKQRSIPKADGKRRAVRCSSPHLYALPCCLLHPTSVSS